MSVVILVQFRLYGHSHGGTEAQRGIKVNFSVSRCLCGYVLLAYTTGLVIVRGRRLVLV
jgi:hypothetical protein